jgi:hypothetical protein
MRDIRYDNAVIFIILACVLGALGFAWEGWNPVLGLLAGGIPTFFLGALVIAADDEDKRG